jgi:hypothetical protein
MIEFPRSCPADILERAFRAINGELGILPSDFEGFLSACEQSHILVLGWETWLIGRADGQWDGLIPPERGNTPMIIGGDAPPRNDCESWRDYCSRAANLACSQIRKLDPVGSTLATARARIRLNFTLEAESP